MNLLKLFGVTIVILAANGWLIAGQEAGQKMSIEMLINDLGSGDGGKRTAATKEIFRRGKAVLPDLKKAGAKQVAPTGATVDTKRLDIVYSAIEGFPPNPPDARSGYKTDSFGLHVEKGMTEDELQKMCKKYGCTLVGKFIPASLPSCYLKIGPGPALEALIQQILSAEPKVTTINLNYFVG